MEISCIYLFFLAFEGLLKHNFSLRKWFSKCHSYMKLRLVHDYSVTQMFWWHTLEYMQHQILTRGFQCSLILYAWHPILLSAGNATFPFNFNLHHSTILIASLCSYNFLCRFRFSWTVVFFPLPFYWKWIFLSHIIYLDYSFPSLYYSHCLSTSPPICIHLLFVTH